MTGSQPRSCHTGRRRCFVAGPGQSCCGRRRCSWPGVGLASAGWRCWRTADHWGYHAGHSGRNPGSQLWNHEDETLILDDLSFALVRVVSLLKGLSGAKGRVFHILEFFRPWVFYEMSKKKPAYYYMNPSHIVHSCKGPIDYVKSLYNCIKTHYYRLTFVKPVSKRFVFLCCVGTKCLIHPIHPIHPIHLIHLIHPYSQIPELIKFT